VYSAASAALTAQAVVGFSTSFSTINTSVTLNDATIADWHNAYLQIGDGVDGNNVTIEVSEASVILTVSNSPVWTGNIVFGNAVKIVNQNIQMILKPHDVSSLPVIARLEALARDARKHGFDVITVHQGEGRQISLRLPRVQGPFRVEEPARRHRD
jgi:hypothetical protein